MLYVTCRREPVFLIYSNLIHKCAISLPLCNDLLVLCVIIVYVVFYKWLRMFELQDALKDGALKSLVNETRLKRCFLVESRNSRV